MIMVVKIVGDAAHDCHNVCNNADDDSDGDDNHDENLRLHMRTITRNIPSTTKYARGAINAWCGSYLLQGMFRDIGSMVH